MLVVIGIFAAVGYAMMPVVPIIVGHYLDGHDCEVPTWAIIIFLATWLPLSPVYGVAWVAYIIYAICASIKDDLR